MPPRLDPAEAARRRKERARRSFSDAAYKHYDPATEGYGSADEWKGTAHERVGAEVVTIREFDADLKILGLDKLPTSDKDLHAVYRRMSRAAHPDINGGSDKAFVTLTDAYDRLKQKFKGAAQ